MLDNDELLTSMKFHDILMTQCRYMGKMQSHKNGFSPFVAQFFFSQKSGFVTLCSHGALTSLKNQKINGQSLEID